MAKSTTQIIPAEDVTYTIMEYPSIVNVNDALNYLFRKPPIIASMTGGSVNQKGQIITIVSIGWTLSGDTPTFSTLTDVPSFDVNTSPNPYIFSVPFLTTDYTYTMTVGDAIENPSDTASQTVHFTQKLYYGNNANPSLTSGQIIALGDIGLTDTRLHTLSINGEGNYLYISYPVAYGPAAIWVSGLLDSSWIQATVAVTNESGYVEDFYTYRSFYPQAGSGIPVQIQ